MEVSESSAVAQRAIGAAPLGCYEATCLYDGYYADVDILAKRQDIVTSRGDSKGLQAVG